MVERADKFEDGYVGAGPSRGGKGVGVFPGPATLGEQPSLKILKRVFQVVSF